LWYHHRMFPAAFLGSGPAFKVFDARRPNPKGVPFFGNDPCHGARVCWAPTAEEWTWLFVVRFDRLLCRLFAPRAPLVLRFILHTFLRFESDFHRSVRYLAASFTSWKSQVRTPLNRQDYDQQVRFIFRDASILSSAPPIHHQPKVNRNEIEMCLTAYRIYCNYRFLKQFCSIRLLQYILLLQRRLGCIPCLLPLDGSANNHCCLAHAKLIQTFI